MNKVRMKVTITGYYEADTKDYGILKDNPTAMAETRRAFIGDDYLEAIHSMDDEPVITVEPA